MATSVRLGGCCALLAALVLTTAATQAADQSKGIGPFDPQYETLELFAAIESGKIEAQVIPKDHTHCKLLVTNKSDKPLNLKLPDVMAAVPALAQMGLPPIGPLAPGNNRRGANRTAKDHAPQALAVPFQNPFQNKNNNNNPLMNMPNNNRNNFGNNNMGNNNRQPFAPFSIAPERVGQLKLPAVCLQHGQPEPHAAVPYLLQRIETVSTKPELVEVCRMLGHGEIRQIVAQAAAWHLANDMSWDELTHMQIKVLGSSTGQPYFTKKEIAAAKEAVGKAGDALKAQKAPVNSTAGK
jgi:hypothetical protein